jgi:beta-glucosidase
MTYCVQHFIGNEQELNRNPSINADNETVESISSNVDDKTLHELYLWPFADAVRAGSGNVMCSYNRINNSYACQNSKTLNGILKEELGFQGFVVSDWGAQHTGVASTLSGLDMAMPNSIFWGENMTEAIHNGSVPESRLTDMATRIIAAWYQMGQDSADYPAPGIGMPFDTSLPHEAVIAKDPAAKTTILQGAIEGHVLVKNTNNALPLKSPKLLSLFGYDGIAPSTVDALVSYNTWSLGYESAPGGLLALFEPTLVAVPQIAINGTIISGGGSGANSPAYVSSPFDAITVEAYNDNTNLFWDFTNINSTAAVDAASDACLVFINAFATEGIDRPGLHDDYSDALVLNIAAQCANTMVIIHNAGVRLVDQWIEHPNVTAVIFAHLPGQDSGRALVEILYGRSPPSGKLPYTVAMNESQYGSLLSPTKPSGEYVLFPQDDFSEGVLIDYRAFDAVNATPRFEFGFGLSYTTFSYGSLGINVLSNVSKAMYPVGAILPGGAEDLWDVIATVSAEVTNTGSVDGIEVAQLYVGIPGGPVKQLRGFSKVDITPGATVSVEFNLLRRDLSEWYTGAQQWALQTGDYAIYVGASSRILPLEGTLTIQIETE